MQNSVLIFESSPVLRELCVDVLVASGFSVDTVSDTTSAVSATMSSSYSFIIIGDTDSCSALSLPVSIRAAELACDRYTPIIGLCSQSDRSSCFSAGMDDYVQMPLSINAFKEIIDRWFHYSVGRWAISDVA